MQIRGHVDVLSAAAREHEHDRSRLAAGTTASPRSLERRSTDGASQIDAVTTARRYFIARAGARHHAPRPQDSRSETHSGRPPGSRWPD